MSSAEKYLERAYDALESSKILLQSGKFNAAASQAYYAIYYAARALLSVKGIRPKTHRGLVAKFGLEFVAKGYIEETYGKILAKALSLRERADYDVDYSVSEEEATAIVDDAERFVEIAASVLEKIGK